MSGEAREEVLARIRRAVADAPPADGMPRAYRNTGTLDAAARAARFSERLAEYGVEVQRAARADLAEAIANRLRARGHARILAPRDLPVSWRAPDVAWYEEEACTPADIDRLEGVVTSCAVAIAETGTIVLDGGPGQGRRAASLVPDYHLCVVDGDRLVELLPEALAAVEDAVRSGRPLTLISGPSATSDIELIRVAGVHGPRTLDVVLVDAD